MKTKWFTLAGLFVLVFFVFSIAKTIPSLRQSNKELGILNSKISDANKLQQEYDKQKDYINSDAYLERQARLKLNYKKADENVVFIYKDPHDHVPAGQTSTTKSADAKTLVEPSSNWRKWWNYLIKK